MHVRVMINLKYLINQLSSFVVAVVCKGVHIATESALKNVFGLDLHSFWTFAHLVPNLGAVVANVVLWICFRKLLKQLFCALEIFLNKDFRVVVCAFGSLLAIPVHVVPAKFPDNVFELAAFSLETEPHVKVRTTLINVPVGTMLSPLAFLFHKIWTNLEVMAEITLVSVTALTQTFKLVTWFDFALVVRVGTVVGESALAVDKLFAYSVGGEFVVVGGSRCGLVVGCVVGGIEGPRIGWDVVLMVHLIKYYQKINQKEMRTAQQTQHIKKYERFFSSHSSFGSITLDSKLQKIQGQDFTLRYFQLWRVCYIG